MAGPSVGDQAGARSGRCGRPLAERARHRVHRSVQPAVLRGAFTAADVRRAGRLGDLHLRLRHRRGPAATDGEGAAAGPGRPPVGAQPRLPADLARTTDGRFAITPAGREFADADILASKQLFARNAARRAPLVRAIVQSLAATENHKLREDLFLDLLRAGFDTEDARRQLETAIDWGRYGELYDYDADDAEFALDPGAEAAL
ncbi:AAA-associated domain-containing protein [Kitasatospora sp. NPDC058190]|uniref:AAA-associated domain-containing protein n=1 Tax=Kitasatospora sp. NPDC058190 TaxID=3346371 RepID=UPI0036DE17EA